MNIEQLLPGGLLPPQMKVVIGKDGELKLVDVNDISASGEILVTNPNDYPIDIENATLQLMNEQDEAINADGDVAALLEALEQGQDPTLLGEEFATAAGNDVSSSIGQAYSLEQVAQETIATTSFTTEGLQGVQL